MTLPDGTTIARHDILGVHVSALSMAQTLTQIGAWAADGARQYVCVTGVHGVMESHDDPALRAIHNAAGLVTPDGMPLVWLLRAAGHRHVERVYGPDLLLAVLAAPRLSRLRHYFYGGGPGVAERLSNRLQARFPQARLVGHDYPPFRPQTAAEDAAATARINAAQPDIVWAGLSTPKQERWMATHLGQIDAAVMIGIGAAFDIHAGLKPQAPRWMQRSGLEWLFRLATEPRRLAGRYLRNNPRFILLLLQQRLQAAAGRQRQ
jgi:N-acetylglucosaminyldiphosphoundecaprenol N-acetyl-beta-D-mannosaminyltransferase